MADEEVWLRRRDNVIDRVIMPTRDAKALEAWFHDPAMIDVSANITPLGAEPQVLWRRNYTSMQRKVIA